MSAENLTDFFTNRLKSMMDITEFPGMIKDYLEERDRKNSVNAYHLPL